VTSELDAASRQLVMELLRSEADRGVAVVLATHDPEAAALCDAELHLVDGSAELLRVEPASASVRGTEQAHDPAKGEQPNQQEKAVVSAGRPGGERPDPDPGA
jgi:ABC-type multidrug transport system ATPase subunit